MKKENENNEEEEKKISKPRLVYELYRQSPAFKALIKLSLYFLLCFVILIVVATAKGTSKDASEAEESNKTTAPVSSKSYRDILNDLLVGDAKFSYVVTNLDNKYYITYDYADNIESGLFESETTPLKKFVIKDNIVYEVVLNEEKENPELFLALKLEYININSLVDLLMNSKGLKMLEDDITLYKYDIDGVKIDVSVKSDNIVNIEIIDADTNYLIEIK